MAFSVINFMIEFTLGVIFIFLWRFFNAYIKEQQFNISKGLRCFSNFAIITIIVLYFTEVIFFELLDSIFTCRD